MTYVTKQLGQFSENLAANFLRKKGYKIIDQNFRTRFGEIDILAMDGKTLVIVEVKAKTSTKYGLAVEMVHIKKQQKLLLLYNELQVKYQTENIRIDVVSVDDALNSPKITHYPGAVELR